MDQSSTKSSAGPSPWQAPPDYVAHSLVASFLSGKRRWGAHVALLRLVSRDWRTTVDSVLPVLAPRTGVPLAKLAALCRRCTGLRVLRVQEPECSYGAQGQAAVARALADICASCTGLSRLELIRWSHLQTFQGQGPLSALSGLTRLNLQHSPCEALLADALRQLPQLRNVSAPFSARSLAGVSGLERLESLSWTDTPCSNKASLKCLGRLTTLRHLSLLLGLAGCEPLSHLSSLHWLTSLELHGSVLSPAKRTGTQHGAASIAAPSAGYSVQKLVEVLATLGSPGLAGGGLRRLQLNVQHLHLSLGLLPQQLVELSVGDSVLQAATFNNLSRLSALTALCLNAPNIRFESHIPPDAASTAVSAVGRRLLGLRKLEVFNASGVNEQAWKELSALGHLTELCLSQANDFGWKALHATVGFMRGVKRLSLSSITVQDAGVKEMLNEIHVEDLMAEEEVRSGIEMSAAQMGGLYDFDVISCDVPEPVLSKHLTYLSLNNCHLLSASGWADLVNALPYLRDLRHVGSPRLDRASLERVLLKNSHLQRFRTSWEPAAAPGQEPMFDDLVDDYMETGGSGVDVLARWNESKAQHDSDLAFVRQWRMKLEHSGRYNSRTAVDFDALAALAEAGVAL